MEVNFNTILEDGSTDELGDLLVSTMLANRQEKTAKESRSTLATISDNERRPQPEHNFLLTALPEPIH